MGPRIVRFHHAEGKLAAVGHSKAQLVPAAY
jgi:hypothetical protein